MKFQHKKSNNHKGSVLIVTLLIGVILGILMSSYLVMVQTQHFSVTRARAWNNAIVVAEAVVEDAMAHINDTHTIGGKWTPVNGWQYTLGSGTYWKTNAYLGYYVQFQVPPAVTNLYPVITAISYVPGPIGTPAISRTVRVKTTPISATFASGAMVVTDGVTFDGSGVTTDSFQSTNLTLFPGGLYNSTNAMDHGDVSSTSTNGNNSVYLGNAKVHGSVHTALGQTATIVEGASGSVGDNAWVNGGKTGIEAGHVVADANQPSFPDATLPDTGAQVWQTLQQYKTNGVFTYYYNNGVAYKYYVSAGVNNNWKIANLDDSVYVNGPINLQVTTTVSFPNSGQIYIAPGKSLSLYVAAPSFTLGGNGVINGSGVSSAFQYYGLPSNTALTLSANASFVGQIYAPEAVFKLGGGGNNVYDYAGLCLTKSVTMNGHFNFHFDESSVYQLKLFGYLSISWDEL